MSARCPRRVDQIALSLLDDCVRPGDAKFTDSLGSKQEPGHRSFEEDRGIEEDNIHTYTPGRPAFLKPRRRTWRS